MPGAVQEVVKWVAAHKGMQTYCTWDALRADGILITTKLSLSLRSRIKEREQKVEGQW
jgi:hypothetical protein